MLGGSKPSTGGEWNESVLLWVYMREAYITIPDEVEAVVGVDREVTIRCRFGGFQPKDGDSMHSWSISWTKQGGDFSLLTNFAGQIFSKNEDNKYTFVNMSDGSGECSMKIANLSQEDQGYYQIQIQYKEQLTKRVYLFMTEPAAPTAVVMNTTAVKVVQNEPSVLINCFVFGAHPKVKNVLWLHKYFNMSDHLPPEPLFREGTDSGSSNTHKERSAMKRYVMTKVNSGRHFEHFTLKLLNVQRQDSGKYFCQADNGHGATTGDMDVRVR
ncbi:uncharacterized protein LOC142356295, partial [Convolutriloba macropyga]|uniref:uncharacterized protein LOC142356295 n=1 Tax=Convolutriloba macropyga TaxID=536237 RepID=UPI003F51BE31